MRARDVHASLCRHLRKKSLLACSVRLSLFDIHVLPLHRPCLETEGYVDINFHWGETRLLPGEGSAFEKKSATENPGLQPRLLGQSDRSR